MSPEETKSFEKALAILKKDGLLLLADKSLPSLVSMIAGGAVKGSWWGHPKGKTIFNVSCELEDHADVLAAKLVAGKVTYIHRALWPALLAVATSRESWQTEGLSAGAKALLARVEKEGRVRPGGKGDPARELESRLLAFGASEHTESGAHAKVVESWASWAREKKVRPLGSVEAGRRAIEEAAGVAPLPWRAKV